MPAAPLKTEQALKLHQEGRLDEAAALAQEILLTHPGHGDALHLLGVIAIQRGQPAPAEALIRRGDRGR